jgi:hypothetical protein
MVDGAFESPAGMKLTSDSCSAVTGDDAARVEMENDPTNSTAGPRRILWMAHRSRPDRWGGKFEGVT